jgi:hypothetical protein
VCRLGEGISRLQAGEEVNRDIPPLTDRPTAQALIAFTGRNSLPSVVLLIAWRP